MSLSGTQRTRSNLYSLFRNGATDKAYTDFIQSTINILDDGIDTDDTNGLKLTSKGPSKKLMSFRESMNKPVSWNMALNNGNLRGLSIQEGSDPRTDQVRFFIKEGGDVGIGTGNPKYKLDVTGLIAMDGRVGNFAKGYVDADGDWHRIMSGLDGCQAFEAFAHINDMSENRFGLTFAKLIISHGLQGAVIRIESGSRWFWGRFFNKISYRWVIDKENSFEENLKYAIEIKSKTHYGLAYDGSPKKIFYRIAKLWDRNFEADDYIPIQAMQPESQQTIASSAPAAQPQQVSPSRAAPKPVMEEDDARSKLRIKKKN